MADIRLAMTILAGSLSGTQLGAIGTTYVKPSMIKIVMGTIMVIVLFSRALMIPVYMSELRLMPAIDPGTAKMLSSTSFAIMIFALALGAFIALKAMWQGRHPERLQTAHAPAAIQGKI